jgi:hypothetical protein
MLALTFTTGIVDAVGYLGLDRVFTANMTGNVVILGMALEAHACEEQDLGAISHLVTLDLVTRMRSGVRLLWKLQNVAHGRTYQQIAPESETPNAFDCWSYTGKES